MGGTLLDDSKNGSANFFKETTDVTASLPSCDTTEPATKHVACAAGGIVSSKVLAAEPRSQKRSGDEAFEIPPARKPRYFE